MAATLQFLTNGRLVLGIGAGWHDEEYRSYGYGYPTRKVRVDQLSEALLILTLLWQGGPVTFRGEHYVDHRRVLPSRADDAGRAQHDLTISANVTVNFPENVDDFVGIEDTWFPEYDNDQLVYGPTRKPQWPACATSLTRASPTSTSRPPTSAR